MANNDRLLPENFVRNVNGYAEYVLPSRIIPDYGIKFRVHHRTGQTRIWRCSHCVLYDRTDLSGRTGNYPVWPINGHTAKECSGFWETEPDGGVHICGWPSTEHYLKRLKTADVVPTIDHSKKRSTLTFSKSVTKLFFQTAHKKTVKYTAIVSGFPVTDCFQDLVPLKEYELETFRCLICNQRRHKAKMIVFLAHSKVCEKWIHLLGGQPFRRKLERTKMNHQRICRSHFPFTENFVRLRSPDIPIILEGTDEEGMLPEPIRNEHDYLFTRSKDLLLSGECYTDDVKEEDPYEELRRREALRDVSTVKTFPVNKPGRSPFHGAILGRKRPSPEPLSEVKEECPDSMPEEEEVLPPPPPMKKLKGLPIKQLCSPASAQEHADCAACVAAKAPKRGRPKKSKKRGRPKKNDDLNDRDVYSNVAKYQKPKPTTARTLHLEQEKLAKQSQGRQVTPSNPPPQVPQEPRVMTPPIKVEEVVVKEEIEDYSYDQVMEYDTVDEKVVKQEVEADPGPSEVPMDQQPSTSADVNTYPPATFEAEPKTELKTEELESVPEYLPNPASVEKSHFPGSTVPEITQHPTKPACLICMTECIITYEKNDLSQLRCKNGHIYSRRARHCLKTNKIFFEHF
ncbi:unnamed protein product [Caenorhabditis auriculariae]|uniref:THAP-type domain-containing protein n=1 Tax=Caenorhabditis auriculariae TaxID=2777116 RepID=A0A8S1HBD2_9PELO|nr:unnamed protein product [Caenorhabditis auriculariae]